MARICLEKGRYVFNNIHTVVRYERRVYEEPKTVFKGFYAGGHRPDCLPVRQRHGQVRAAAVSAKPHRLLGAVRRRDGLRLSPGHSAVPRGRHGGGQGEQAEYHGGAGLFYGGSDSGIHPADGRRAPDSPADGDADAPVRDCGRVSALGAGQHPCAGGTGALHGGEFRNQCGQLPGLSGRPCAWGHAVQRVWPGACAVGLHGVLCAVGGDGDLHPDTLSETGLGGRRPPDSQGGFCPERALYLERQACDWEGPAGGLRHQSVPVRDDRGGAALSGDGGAGAGDGPGQPALRLRPGRAGGGRACRGDWRGDFCQAAGGP